jgi:hypothetical protein
MWAQGMSGTKIADDWRAYNPLAAVRVNCQVLPAKAIEFGLDAARAWCMANL